MVARFNLTVVYARPRKDTIHGCLAAALVVFGQSTGGLSFGYAIENRAFVAWRSECPSEGSRVHRSMNRIYRGILVLTACAAFALAQDQAPSGQPPANQDPNQPDGQYEPGRAVARIAVINGDVSVRRGDSGDVVAAAVNGPVMADDRLLTGASARAEVQLDSANVVRIGPNSEVRFSGMDVKYFQMQVGAGTVTLRVLRQGQAQTEVDTPSVALHALRPGTYRIVMHDDGTSELTVRSGEAEIFSSSGSEHVEAGQTMNARGTGADTEFQVVQAIAPDAWDRWNDERDRLLQRSTAYQHVSPDITGAEDLDQNGRWTQDPTYGQVWQPTNVDPGWAPYQCGRWVWEDFYGWTWLSCDTWGWAPYHYGRWFWGVGGWAWYPGPAYARYYWSPALVGFFGYGPGIGVGFGFGGIGWVPLAPFEVVHPWWGRGFYGGFRAGVFGRPGIVGNVNIANTFRNARINGGVTGANTADFGRRSQFTSLNRGQIQSAGLVRGALPVAPDRSSLRMSDRAAAGNFAQSRGAGSFVSHTQATRPNRVSFDQQQRGMQQMSRSSSFGGGGSFGGERGAGSAGAGASRGGWNRFGESGGAGQSARGGSGPASSASPRSFGGGSQPVRISPSIVQQRPSAPSSYGRAGGSAPSGRSSGGASRGGGGGHSGGGHR
jgi:hypothetical protein